MREDVGYKFRCFRNDLRKRRPVHMSSCYSKPIKAAEHLVFAVPKARYRAYASNIGVHAVGRNLGHGNVAHDSTKRLQGAGLSVEAHAHALLIGNILGGKSRQLHRRPPKSKFATSRSPARSTLA